MVVVTRIGAQPQRTKEDGIAEQGWQGGVQQTGVCTGSAPNVLPNHMLVLALSKQQDIGDEELFIFWTNSPRKTMVEAVLMSIVCAAA